MIKELRITSAGTGHKIAAFVPHLPISCLCCRRYVNGTKLMKALLLLLISSVALDAHADGGISSLSGLGEALAFAGSVIAISAVWLIFALVVLFGRKKRMNRLNVFRKTILVFIVLGGIVILSMTLLVYTSHWEILAYFVVFSIFIIGLTELEILFFQKRHNKLSKRDAEQGAPS